MTRKGELRLYVTASTMLSLRAIENIEKLTRGQLACEYDLEVVDVLVRPDLAERDRIFATPTLVRLSPLPVRKLIGDLSDRDKVLGSLELADHGAEPSSQGGPP